MMLVEPPADYETKPRRRGGGRGAFIFLFIYINMCPYFYAAQSQHNSLHTDTWATTLQASLCHRRCEEAAPTCPRRRMWRTTRRPRNGARRPRPQARTKRASEMHFKRSAPVHTRKDRW
jgi:hypothetical protein